MPSLKRIIESNDTTAGKVFNFSIQILIVISLLGFSLETLPGLSSGQLMVLNTLETITVLIFTAEYILRLAVADNKLKFIFSFYGIVDILAILPFYVTTGIDLRTLRTFRFLRIFRLLKLVRYSVATRRLFKAIALAKEEIILFFSLTFVLMYLAAVGIYYFENNAQPEAFSSIFQSLWWAVVTLTTVGYGDVVPVTTGGKAFTFFILILGLAIVAIPTGLFSSALTRVREMEAQDKKKNIT